MWRKHHLKFAINMVKLACKLALLCHLNVETRGDTMKIAFIMFAALTIGALLTISAFQLLKVVIQEMVSFSTEAWHSPEQH